MDDSAEQTEVKDTELTLLSRDELEDMVRTRTEALGNVMDTMVDILLKLSPDGRIEMANEPVESILGYETDELIGQPVDQLLTPPEQTDDADNVLHHEEFITMLLREGQVTDVEVACSTADDEVIPMSLSASVMRDADGGVAGIVCVAKDISERKAAEEKAEFLHSLLRHDVGNKLQIVHGYLTTLSDADLGETEREYLKNGIDGVEEALDLLEKVRTLNRVDDDETASTVILSDPIDAAIERNEDLSAQEGFEIDPPANARVQVQGGTLLKELFANLVENSIKHSNGSRIEVSVADRSDEAVVVLEDDGEGIPDEEKDQIVERGYSGASSTGSGLGMFLAKRTAETYGGSLEIGDSDLGGARFEITLPK